MTTRLYLPRMSHPDHDQMMLIHHWIEAQWGKPDYHKNYSLGFGDQTDDWCLYTFYDDAQAFWTLNRWPQMLTESRWHSIVQDPHYQNKRIFGTLELT